MLERIFGNQVVNFQKALTRTSQRQVLLTQNLANVNTPGYHRRDLDFNIELEQAHDRFAKTRHHGPDAVTVFSGAVRADGSTVNMEAEVAAMAETELRYESLSDLTRRYFGGLRDVIREGK